MTIYISVIEGSEVHAIVMIHSKSLPKCEEADTSSRINRSKSDSEWRGAWITAAMRAKDAKDPWEEYDIPSSCGTEKAYRYRYNALEKKWVKDEVEVKMQKEVSSSVVISIALFCTLEPHFNVSLLISFLKANHPRHPYGVITYHCSMVM